MLSWLLEYRFRFFLIRLSFKIIYVFHGNSLWCFSFRMSYDKKKMKRHWDIVFRLYKFTKYKRKLFYRKPSVEINKMSICDPNGFKYTGGLLTSLSNQKIWRKEVYGIQEINGKKFLLYMRWAICQKRNLVRLILNCVLRTKNWQVSGLTTSGILI